MTKFGILWLSWICMFLVIELIAATNDSTGDTLSEWIWKAISHPLLYFPFGGFLAWLVLHFLTKGKVGGW